MAGRACEAHGENHKEILLQLLNSNAAFSVLSVVDIFFDSG
jgi:hypothetical protein